MREEDEDVKLVDVLLLRTSELSFRPESWNRRGGRMRTLWGREAIGKTTRLAEEPQESECHRDKG
jgi:hypothetical protein